ASYTSCLEVLTKFDYVLLTYRESIEPVSKEIESQCAYLPFGVDALLFCPIPNPPARCIDILSYGRRSERLHHILLELSAEDGFFYVHDTTKGLHTYDLLQHRLMRANFLKRSRFCIVNPGGRFDKSEVGSQSEIGARYFEGVAAGAIMIGLEPKIDEFRMYFGWPDAVVKLSEEQTKSEVALILDELIGQRERQEAIRTNNIVHGLLRHDWLYRWEAILHRVGLDPLPELVRRKQKLQDLAKLL
ncbi:MAG: glycosyltransferase family 1 protein, partial [Nitrospira sp.]|nr:glycosyltransferase family 1 protein [Nitrospira sp.]